MGIIESQAPGCSVLYFQSCSLKDWEEHMTVTFKQASSVFTDANYQAYSAHLTSITFCLTHLEESRLLRHQLSSCLGQHQPDSTAGVLKLLINLERLFKVLQSLRIGIQQQFWAMLDSDTQASTEKLQEIMVNVSPFFCFNRIPVLLISDRFPQKNETNL